MLVRLKGKSRSQKNGIKTVKTAALIRPVRSEDVPVLCDLLGDLFEIEADFSADRRKQENGLRLLLEDRSGRSKVFVAVHGGRVIGMCSVQVVISTAEGKPAAIMEDVVVKREHRGSGFGTALVEAVQEWCLERGITRVQVLADKDNLQALTFYANKGWFSTNLICLRKNL
jgi:GNAT superfamily N-acetyltransferase